MGHSWASGLQPSADGKNQESSSEAVNGYQAVALLGRATDDPVLEGWGQLLLSTEVAAAHKYTQAFAGNDIYQQVGMVLQQTLRQLLMWPGGQAVAKTTGRQLHHMCRVYTLQEHRPLGWAERVHAQTRQI